MDNILVSNMSSSIVPISRFDKGEASKIFEEVRESGVKVVVKNNKPCAVLISIEKYKEMMETIEKFRALKEE